MNKKIILITDRIQNPNFESEVFGKEYEIYFLDNNLKDADNELLRTASGILVWHSLLDSDFLSKLNYCKGIVRYGTGFDNIDLNFARNLNIPVCNTPDYGIEEVADTTCAFILNAIRQIKEYEHQFSTGSANWGYASNLNLRRTSNHFLGIVGCGRIGTAVALRMKSFGLEIGFYDPNLPPGYEKSIGIKRFSTIEGLISQSTILSFHVPLNEETKGMINRNLVQQFRENTILVNTARGSIISDLHILTEAVKTNKIQFLGLDVMPDESGDQSNEIFDLWKKSSYSGRISITPHSAYYSEAAFPEMRTKAALNLKGIIEGKRPLNLVNNLV